MKIMVVCVWDAISKKCMLGQAGVSSASLDHGQTGSVYALEAVGLGLLAAWIVVKWYDKSCDPEAYYCKHIQRMSGLSELH